MPKKVVVIASGETERRSLPLLLRELDTEGVDVVDVRIPPRNRMVNVELAEKLVKAAWFEMVNDPPEKFVILLDADGKNPDDILRPFREQLPKRLQSSTSAHLQFAFAQWHLEAWYFADSAAMRGYLGRALGNVDTSRPDEIQNPKLHLKHLLGNRVYTALISEEIAAKMTPAIIAQRSPSFHGFLNSIRNGGIAQSH